VAEEIILSTRESPKKLENYLKKRFPIGFVRKLFRRNGIRLNGKHPKPGDLIQPGDRILLYLPFQEDRRSSASQEPEPQKLGVIFEDDGLLAVNKPAGVPVHEGKEVWKRHSVIGILEAKYRGAGVVPRLVHRLDKETSGILLVAKDEKVAERLEKCFEEGNVDKEYLCLVVGRLPQNDGKIDLPLTGRNGRPVRALTRFKVVKRFSEATLVKVAIDTGRMHQIRLHFAKLGYPVVMDDQHGDFAFNKRFRKEYGLKRQFLHASRLTLNYGGKKQTWTAPLPEDLKRTLERLARG
jgi:23S rRNA pseudouridine955/2504/2580 synthase